MTCWQLFRSPIAAATCPLGKTPSSGRPSTIGLRQRAWVGFERLGKHTEHMPHTHARLIGAQPDTRLLDELTRAGLEARSIGDCQHIGYIEGAISAGHKAYAICSATVQRMQSILV